MTSKTAIVPLTPKSGHLKGNNNGNTVSLEKSGAGDKPGSRQVCARPLLFYADNDQNVEQLFHSPLSIRPFTFSFTHQDSPNHHGGGGGFNSLPSSIHHGLSEKLHGLSEKLQALHLTGRSSDSGEGAGGQRSRTGEPTTRSIDR